MFCRFVVASNLCVLILTIVIFCMLLIMFSCVWCDTLLDVEYDVLLVFIGVLYLRLYILRTLDCCVLELGCGSARKRSQPLKSIDTLLATTKRQNISHQTHTTKHQNYANADVAIVAEQYSQCGSSTA